jgi:hypothetical protein
MDNQGPTLEITYITDPTDPIGVRSDLAQSFTGADVQALIIVPNDEVRLQAITDYLQKLALTSEQINNDLTPTSVIYQKVEAQNDLINSANRQSFLKLINLTAITTSTFRAKTQVRALGHVNPIGIARGSRTIAGTMILTEFDRDAFWNIITNGAFMPDVSVGAQGDPLLVDQITPFDMLLLFQNELGAVAYRYISSIEIVTNGNVYSIQDMYHENTLSFLCLEVTPLTPEQMKINFEGNIPLGKRWIGTRVDNLSSLVSGKEITRRFRQSLAARRTEL